MPNSILLAALDYLARGWSVVPVQGKQPLERWQRWQLERMTTRQAEQLFSRPEVTGVAIVCGAISGLTVLDFDGLAGRNAFLELYGNGTIELTQPTVTTGSSGKHLYFAATLEQRPRTGATTGLERENFAPMAVMSLHRQADTRTVTCTLGM